MAPITEKRSQSQPQSHPKESGRSFAAQNPNSGNHNSHQMFTHAKENSNTRHSKRGLEILDFHESWLEEMEIYKDQMSVQKHQQQQLLSLQNHMHAPKSCQLQSFNASLINAITAAVAAKTTFQEVISQQSGRPKTSDPKNGNGNKPRVVVRAPIAGTAVTAAVASANAMAAAAVDNRHGELLILKRPRDELVSNGGKAAASTGNSKRHTRPHSHSQSHQHHPLTVTAPPASQNPAKSGIASTSAGRSTAKIIVNQFHASSLLNAHQHEEKTKILAQNGLTKSAATAYETSLYASHYLPQNSRSGVAKSGGGDTERNRATGGGIGNSVDDPCSAIDDVNEYTDSDSEEEYIGFPFYLDEDGNEMHQSRNIRWNAEQASTVSSEEDEATGRSEYFTPKSILSPSIFPNVPPYLNFSSHAVKGPPMPAPLHKVLKWKLSPVMPKIVKRVVLNSGFRIIKNTTDWMAIWEKHMKSPGFRTIRSHQKYNHMPGSFRIGRKDSMWRSIYSNMKKFGNKEFGFMQKSYVMPDDLESLRQVWPKNASKLTKWIVKPPASARGTGIRVVNKWSQFPKDRPLVVQKYIERPLLINDSKFDMRIYVVVTSINPLRIYMYKDGLARFASVKYSSEINSLDDRCMHLTNYSINKFSENYSKNEDFNACQGHKWTLQSLWSCLEARGVNTKRLWATLRNLVIKAIVSGESGLNRMYRQNVNFRYNCFELFGFDVLLDENLVPWLLEINISPSLHSELPLDLHVKGPLIQAVLNTALYQVPPKLAEKQQKDIQQELNLNGPLCHDKRIFTTCLTTEEVRKHNQFTNRAIEFREEYLESILENLLPDDVRCLIVTEDEFARSQPLERIFPTPDTHSYLKFIDNPRYYNRLLDAWEFRYGKCREEGIALLTRHCEAEYHLQVSDEALEKEPNVTLTEIDMLHAKKSEDPLAVASLLIASASNSANTSKAGSPDTNADGSSIGLTTVHCAKEASLKSVKEHSSTRTIVMKVNGLRD